uniref:Uncharacterized protein n=1 Tax=Peronospora matthiolae TaxID=2874970 RepID=A0AAV1UN11_9STRA
MYSAEVTKLSSDAVSKLLMGKRTLSELNEFFYWLRDLSDMWLEENREPKEVFALMPKAVWKPFSPSMDVYDEQTVEFFLFEWLTYVKRVNIKNLKMLMAAWTKLGAFEQLSSNASVRRFKPAAE